MTNYEILVIDDDPLIRKTTSFALQQKGYNVTMADNGLEGIELIKKRSFNVVISDLMMEPIDGIGVLKKAKELWPEIIVIILTGYGNTASAIEALRLDADDYLLKPCEIEELNLRMKHCIEKLELSKKIKNYERILSVCSMCKKIRIDKSGKPGAGKWIGVEEYMLKKAKIAPSSTYCPECAKKAMEEFENDV
ncbi:Response regulator [Candidatus Magnetomoraceae bacterium gMMP-15]